MVKDLYDAHWAAIAEAAEHISRSEHCGPEQAEAFCRAIDRLSDALQGEITHLPRVTRKPDFWGFIDEAECRIEMCFTPDGPGPGGRFAVPLWTLAQPLEEDEAACRR